MKYGLKESTLKNIIDVFDKSSRVKKILLYGSRAKGNYKEGSDIDLALVGGDISAQDLNKILLELDELYLPYIFDLVIFEKIQNQDLISHINRVGIVIYNRLEDCPSML